MWIQVLIAGAWGGLCAVERRAFLQAMISRPLVAATGMGALLGDIRSGLFTGLVLELYYLGAASLGAVRPENDTLSALGVAAAAAALSLPHKGSGAPAAWTVALLALVPLGQVGRALDAHLEGHSSRLVEKAVESAAVGKIPQAVRLNLYGMWPYAAAYGAIAAGAVLMGKVCAPILEVLPPRLLRGLTWAYPAMASVAAAIAVRASRARRAWFYALLSALAVAALTLLRSEVRL